MFLIVTWHARPHAIAHFEPGTSKRGPNDGEAIAPQLSYPVTVDVDGIVARWLEAQPRGGTPAEQVHAAKRLLDALRELEGELTRLDGHWRPPLATLIADVDAAVSAADPHAAIAAAGRRFLGSPPSSVAEAQGAQDWYSEPPPEQSPSPTNFAWFAHPPQGYVPEEDQPITSVRIRAVAHAGPFWDEEGSCLGDDFDELHKWLGISRALYDDVMAWYDEYERSGHRSEQGHREQRVELLRRLSREVRPGIEVSSTS